MKAAPDENLSFDELDEDTEEIKTRTEKDTDEKESNCNWGPDTVVFYGNSSRAILITGEITNQSNCAISSQIRELARLSDQPITIYLNTWGGSIVDALGIYDLLKSIPNNVVTIVTGACYSAGLIILAAGDIRLATKHSRFFYHQPIMSEVEISDNTSLTSTMSMYKWSQKKMNQIIKERTQISKKKWLKTFDNQTNVNFDVTLALKLNFLDSVLQYQEKPKITLGD